jgi:putative flavoprotein involved in K+ transport
VTATLDSHDVIVIGAGPAGLGVAGALRRSGVNALILERSGAVGESWRKRYDRLHLNTLRTLSDLHGYRMSRKDGPYPSRDAFASYLERYAKQESLAIRFNCAVTRLELADCSWSVHLHDEVLDAQQVVVATGYDAEPAVPDWRGLGGFTGAFMHAASYRNSTPFAGQDVLVIGAGNTASDVTTDLALGAASRVRVSIRTPPNIFPRRFFGMHAQYGAILGEPMPRIGDRIGFVVQRLLYGDLSRYGLPRPEEGMHTHFRRVGHGPMVDEGFVDLVKQGRIEVVAAVAGFHDDEVLLADGGRIHPDSVIAATGYRRGLQELVGHLGVLTPPGSPVVGGASTARQAPGLYFIGFVRKMSGQLWPMRGEATQIARAICSRRQRSTGGRRPARRGNRAPLADASNGASLARASHVGQDAA